MSTTNTTVSQPNTAADCGPSGSPRSTPPMPEHMRLDNWPFPYPFSAFLHYIFTGICILAYGHTTLNEVWEVAYEDGERWQKRKDLMAARLNQTNVTGGLLLATLAAWLTTVPPTPTIYDYNALAPYICLLASFGMILGSVIVGSTVLYSTPMITGTWYHKTLLGSRLWVCGTLIMTTYPILSAAAGTSTSIIGFLLVSYNSQIRLVQASCIFMVVIPASLTLILVGSQIYPDTGRLWMLMRRHGRKGHESAV